MMKAVVLVFLLVICQGEALRCYQCTSKSSNLCTPTGIETCTAGNNACGAVIITQPISFSMRMCMNMAVCQGWITTPGAYAICCSTDLCN